MRNLLRAISGEALELKRTLALRMPSAPKLLAICCLSIVVALYVVGAVSIPPGSLRHEVQTLPLWIPIILGSQQQSLAKWTALPLLIFWLTIMSCIWLFLLGWAKIVTGHFFPTEVAMTLVVGAASIIGLITIAKWQTSQRWGTAVIAFVALAALQLLAFRLSLSPYIARR